MGIAMSYGSNLKSKSSFNPTPFAPPFWLTNPHVQTMLPKALMPKLPKYRRQLLVDSLNQSQIAYDFYDSDIEKVGSKTDRNVEQYQKLYQQPLVVLFHGLEGSSSSHYARSLAHQVHSQGWHFVVVHFRSCGGIAAKGDIFYNAGDTVEVAHALNILSQNYATIYAVGVSLGGNVLAKYMGEAADEALCQKAVFASAPVDLASSSIAMERFFGRRVYTPYLLNPLVKKALATKLSKEELNTIKASKKISNFDHVFTAPRHGFRSVNDYYKQASSLPYLINIAKPTLMITAKDDPFLGMLATQNDVSDNVTLLECKHGGHIGFVRYLPNAKPKLDLTWLPTTAIEFFKS